MFDNLPGTSLDRRSFLRGSAIFAATIGLAVVPALASRNSHRSSHRNRRRKSPRRLRIRSPMARRKTTRRS